MKNKKTIIYSTLLLCLLLLAFSSSPPDGRTGAPFDGRCTDCHGGTTNITGNVTIEGLPSTVQPNTQYTITLRMRRTGGNPPRGGFELVAVQGNNTQAGSWSNGTGASFSTSGGRVYWKHSPAKNFSSDEIIWTATWTSPSSAANNQINMYASALFANNASGSSGDFMDLDIAQGTMPPPQPPTVTINNVTNVRCFGESTGSMSANPTGGASPYNYNWSNGQSSKTISNIPVGTYTVTVTDNNGATASAQATITSPPALNLGSPTVRNVSCPGGNNGSLTVNPSGGTPPYTYFWSNNASTKTAGNLIAGTYTVRVTDNLLCATETSYTVTEPDSLQVLAKISNPACPADSNGRISLSLSGANKPYKYKWSTNEVDSSIQNKKIGTYTVTITDLNNCVFTKAFTLQSKDSIAPTFTFKTTKIYLNDFGKAFIDTSLVLSNIKDNCDIAPKINFSHDSLTCKEIGIINFKVLVSDISGNIKSDSVQLEVLDTIAPQISGWADTSFTRCNVTAPEILASDNCLIDSFWQESGIKKFDIFPAGINSQVFFAKDKRGNFTRKSYTTQIINPLYLRIDSLLYDKCQGDTILTHISFGHILGMQMKLTRNITEVSSTHDTATSLVIKFVRPEKVFIELKDSLSCTLKVDSNYTYPDPLISLLNVSLNNPSSAISSDGSIILNLNAIPDSIQCINANTGELINRTGKDLPAGRYTIRAHKDGCEFTFGPYEIKFISSTGQAEEKKILVYPNPVAGEVIIENPLESEISIDILDIHGRILRNFIAKPGRSNINSDNLPQGVLYLYMKSYYGHHHMKLIKQ